MNVDHLYPTYLTNQNFFLFLIQFVFVALIFLGQYFLFCRFQNAWSRAFLYFPFFLFSFGLLSYFAGFGNIFYALVQALLIGYAIFYLVTKKPKLPKISITEWFLYGFIALMGYFSWMVPIPENFNGHGHFITNALLRMLETDSLFFINKTWMAYDNAIFAWPQHLIFMLRLYCIDHPAVFYRSAFLVPMIGGFVLIQMLKDICGHYQLPKKVALLSCLAIIGTYYNSLSLFELQYDVLSLMMLLFFVLILSRHQREKAFPITDAVLLLLISFLIRKQVFIIILFAMIIYASIYVRRVLPIGRNHLIWLCLGALSFGLWSGVAYQKYGSPIYTQDTPLTKEMFAKTIFTFDPQVHLDRIPLKVKGITSSQTVEKGYGERVGVLVDITKKYLPFIDAQAFMQKCKGVLLFIMRAGPLSLGLFIIFLGYWIYTRDPQYRPLLVVVVVLSVGCLLAYFGFFKGYRKFPQYLSIVTALPSGVVLYKAQEKFFKYLPYVLIVWLVFIFHIALFGHRDPELSLNTTQLLLGQKSFTEKIAYKGNKNIGGVIRQSKELSEVYDTGKTILQMDHEPGASMPSLMGREYLAESPYFKTYRSKKIISAASPKELKTAFQEMDISHVRVPQRTLGIMDRHPLLICLRKLKSEGTYALAVPVNKIIESIEY